MAETNASRGNRHGPAGQERSGRTRAVGDILPAVGRAAFRRFGFVESSVVSRWAEIVGSTYARYSAPESLSFPRGKRSGGTLSVVVTSAFAPTIAHVEPQIVERINRFFGYGAVERLVFRHGDLTPPAFAAATPEADDQPPVEPGVSATIREVADPGLRASLEALARRLASTTGGPRFK